MNSTKAGFMYNNYVDDNLRWILPHDVDLLETGAGEMTSDLSPSQVPPAIQESAPSTPPSTGPEPDQGVPTKEQLLERARESINEFFQRATLSKGRVEDITGGYKPDNSYLDSTYSAAVAPLREENEDTTVSVLRDQVRQMRQKSTELTGEITRIAGPNGNVEILMDYLGEQAAKWGSPEEVDRFISELDAAAGEPDPALRDQKLTALKARVQAVAANIQTDASKLSDKSTYLGEAAAAETRNSRYGIEDVQAILPQLRERLGADYARLRPALDEFGLALRTSYLSGKSTMDLLSPELRVLSIAAKSLGYNIEDIVGTFKRFPPAEAVRPPTQA